MLEEGRGPRVPRSRVPKDQDISKSHSNMSLTLKKVHLVGQFFLEKNFLNINLTQILIDLFYFIKVGTSNEEGCGLVANISQSS